jgi:hypothetical protein
MKLTSLTILAILFSLIASAINKDSISVKGYYIIEYKKRQIENKMRNDSLKAKGKKFNEAIDYERNYLFIPSDDTCNSLEKAINSYAYEYRKKIFYLPQDDHAVKYISKNLNFKLDFIGYREKFKDRLYFSSKFNPDYLYCIFYVEGKAIKYHLENSKDNRYLFGLRIDDVTKDNFFDIFLVYNYNMIVSDFVYLDGFQKWIYNP